MSSRSRTYNVGGFGGPCFAIDCNTDDAFRLAEFLFCDFPRVQTNGEPHRYDIVFSGPRPQVSLWHEERKLYFGDSIHELAYILMNEVIYWCIKGTPGAHALHAAALCRGEAGLLLPGKSGAGKSTLAAWLAAHGYGYLSDELVFLHGDGTMTPLVRPICLKTIQEQMHALIPGEERGKILNGKKGAMIPHRLFNPHFTLRHPKVSTIIFPRFVKGAETRLAEMSPARSCFQLLQSHVNSRSHAGLGITELGRIVKQCRSFTLTYGSLEALEKVKWLELLAGGSDRFG